MRRLTITSQVGETRVEYPDHMNDGDMLQKVLAQIVTCPNYSVKFEVVQSVSRIKVLSSTCR